MPIPQLAVKSHSPQQWRKKTFRRRGAGGMNKLPFFTGRGPKNFPPKNLLKTLLMLGVAGIIGLSLLSLAVLAWVAKDLPNPNKIIERNVAQSTKIYDRTGETLLFDIHGEEQRTIVPLSEIPDYVKQATIAAEDRKFYEHKGISFTGIIRSAIKNTFTGSKVGGSTLTQQLVKNAILSPEKKYSRKIKEVILSYQIEKKFSKDEILQLYFNEIPYGSVAYGAEAGAQTYFGKSIKDVNLAEAAILAALPQAPTYYSPYGSHVDALFARQHYVLDAMVEEGYITKEEAETAKQQNIEFKEKKESNIIAPHFVMYIREYLTEKYGESTVEQGGLKVITTLDLYKQKLAEEVMAGAVEKNAQNYNANNAAFVAIDTKTGQILAMIGSKDYFADPYPDGCTPGKDCLFDPQVNAVLRLRQPGSSFKPIVYTAAFDKGYTPETLLYDVNTKFQNYDGRDYEPKNYDLGERGPVTMRKALAGSLNIPAVKTIYLTGVDRVIDLAQDLGYTSLNDRSRFGLSLVLGGAEVELLEHVNAYSVFAREGEWHKPIGILEVRDKDNNVLEEYKKEEKKVLNTNVARQITSVLSDNAARAYIFGENNYLNLGERPVAAKTGTTNDYRDAWTVGYTPSIAVGVWVGNNNNAEMKRGADGSVVAAPIWHGFMSRLLNGTPIETFKEPEPNTSDKPALNGQLAEGIKVKIDKASGKLATSLTPESYVEEKTFQQAHSILHWINKDDPQGDTPPERSGIQYERWEEGVRLWAEKNNIVTQEPPTEFDDVHTIANRPSITITSPNNNETVNSRSFTATVSVSAPRGVSRVEYYLNDQKIATAQTAPFSLNATIDDPGITHGSYRFKAVAFDDIDNSRSDEIAIQFNLPDAPSPISWLSPTNQQSINSGNFPFTVRADLTNAAQIEKINLYFTNGGPLEFINSLRQFPNAQLVASWQSPPPPGSYELVAEITTKSGFIYESDRISITVK